MSPICPAHALTLPLSSTQKCARHQDPPSTETPSACGLPPRPPCVHQGPATLLHFQTIWASFPISSSSPPVATTRKPGRFLQGRSRLLCMPWVCSWILLPDPPPPGAITRAFCFLEVRTAYVWICNYKLYLCESPRKECSLIQPMCCFSPLVPEHMI